MNDAYLMSWYGRRAAAKDGRFMRSDSNASNRATASLSEGDAGFAEGDVGMSSRATIAAEAESRATEAQGRKWQCVKRFKQEYAERDDGGALRATSVGRTTSNKAYSHLLNRENPWRCKTSTEPCESTQHTVSDPPARFGACVTRDSFYVTSWAATLTRSVICVIACRKAQNTANASVRRHCK